MSVSALQQNCHSRALPQSGAERESEREGKRGRGGGGGQRRETDTGRENKVRQIESHWNRKERERERATVGGYMHLTGVYTPALHMSSILSFKSSLQRDRTKHRDNHSQGHKHKIIKEPQTPLQQSTISVNMQKNKTKICTNLVSSDSFLPDRIVNGDFPCF